MRPGPAPGSYELDGRPTSALPGCFGRFALMVVLLFVLLFGMALFAGGPLLQILFSILLSS